MIRLWSAPLWLLALALGGCSGPSAAPGTPPAKTDLVAHESELLKVTLTPAAVARLGLRVEPVAAGAGEAGGRTVPGEIVAANPGGPPIGALTDLGALGAQQARSDADLARAEADVRLAEANSRRAAALVDAEAGSVRARDEATAQLAAARAARQVARDQRRLLGPAIARLGQSGALWVRAALAGADAQQLMADATALVRPLAGGGAVSARPVAGPPTATPGAASIDRYFALPRAAAFRLGQRVLVELPLRGGAAEGALSVPASAILTDINGGEWVYVETAPNAFERRRVEVARIAGDRASLARGLAPGARVITAGAAELFGTEFGTK